MRSHVGWSSSLLVVLLVAVPATTAAELGDLSAATAYFQAGDSECPASVAWIRHNSDHDVASIDYQISATRVEGEIIEERQLVFPVLDFTGAEPTVPMGTEPERIVVQGSSTTLELMGVEKGFITSLYGDATGTSPFGFSGGLGSFNAISLPSLVLADDGIKAGSENAAQGAQTYFTPIPVDQPQILFNAQGVGGQITLTGDLTLEFQGLAFEMVDGDGERTLVEGRETYEPIAAQAPQSDNATAVLTTRFVRLNLTDAEITFESAQFDGKIQWAGSTTEIVPKGSVTITEAIGTVRTKEGDRELDNERFRFDGLPTISLSAIDERMGIRLEGPEGSFDDKGAYVRAGGPGVPGWLILLGATAVFLVLLLVVVLRRRDLALADVESALEAGQYGRAARMAGLILHRDPGQEGAAVARAVALSRAGRHSLVIREVESRLETTDPTDGVLHYVLGLAYLERGQKDEAIIRLEEAVRRTPELASEVGDLWPRSKKAPSGYA